MLTKLTYGSAVFKMLQNIVTICIFIEQKLIEILYEILSAIMAFIAIRAIKEPVCTRYQAEKNFQLLQNQSKIQKN